MKKFIKRRLPALMIVFIMIISFALPTSAASTGWTNAVFNSYDNYLYTTTGSKLLGHRSPNGTGMEWQLPASYPWHGDTVEFYVRAKMSLSLSTGDTFQIAEKTIYGWFGGQENYIISIRYILASEYTTENANGQLVNGIKYVKNGTWKRYEFQGGQSYGLLLPTEEWQLTESYDNCFVGIQFKCTRDSGVENTFSINNFNFHYGYGNKNSPEYSGFQKVNPNSANNLENVENQLKNDTISGINKAYNSFSAFTGTIQAYTKPLLLVADIMNSGMQRMPFIGHLLNISLALGLFGFIVGLAGSILGAADRKSARERRKKEKE